MKMKLKALLIVVTLLAVIIVAGTAAFANNVNGEGNGEFSFRQMLPFMQEHHADWSEQELKEMYEACHGRNNGPGRENNTSRSNNSW